jgi:O-antigen ligase/polysaccharide polymerase Wzy-like membrane protein
MGNYFKNTGSFKIYSPIGILMLIGLTISIGIGITYIPFLFISILALVLIVFFIIKSFKSPKFTLNILLTFSFFVIGLTRIVPLPLGLLLDILLVFIFIVIFIKEFKRIDWSATKNILSISLMIWMLFCIIQIWNVQAVSIEAWFYSVRDMALRPILLVPLIFLAYNKKSDLKTFINIWFLASILLSLYSAKQYFIGLFPFEQYWLNTEGYVTHVIFGKFTRMFSFSSDANQFGNSVAHAGSVALIFLFSEKNKIRRLFYIFTAAACFFGMFMSGTRGAIVVPIISIGAYLVLSKNYIILSIGSILGGILLYLLVFTLVLQSVAPIRRMRTAFDANDASLLVRVENRILLENYLQDKPLGGGIGSAGVWGKRFSPGTFLADFETDGHYVRVYAETGIIGLTIYYLIHLLIIGKMIMVSWKIKNLKLRTQSIGLTTGIIACFVANYSAPVTVSLPSNVIVYWCMAFVFIIEKWSKENQNLLPKINEH